MHRSNRRIMWEPSSKKSDMPDSISERKPTPTIALVLAGGVALGAYEGGAYAALHDQGKASASPSWLASSSIGSVNAAIIAGNEPDRQIEKLRGSSGKPMRRTRCHSARSGWASRNRARDGSCIIKRASCNRCFLDGPASTGRGWHSGRTRARKTRQRCTDLDPLRQSLGEFVNFDLLNSGAVRLSIATTDVVTGERVVFDTAKRHIGPEHVLASCALLPIFAPVEVEGRLLADGCLSANTPIDLVLDKANSDDLICFAVDLFAREGSRPKTMAAGLARPGNLAFANQTRSILAGRQREHRLREVIGRLGERLPRNCARTRMFPRFLPRVESAVASSSISAIERRLTRPGFAKVFDFSRATIDDRWREGASDMRAAIRELLESGGRCAREWAGRARDFCWCSDGEHLNSLRPAPARYQPGLARLSRVSLFASSSSSTASGATSLFTSSISVVGTRAVQSMRAAMAATSSVSLVSSCSARRLICRSNPRACPPPRRLRF